MNDDIERILAGVPEPLPPATLSRTVMARVARLASERSERPLAAPAPLSWRDVVPWAAAPAGLAIVFASWTSGNLVARSWVDLAWAQLGLTTGPASAAHATALTALAFGVLIYAAAVFAPLGRTE